MTLVAVMFVQFRIIDQTDVSALALMRESELRTEIGLLQARHGEVLQRIEETNKLIAEYQEIIDTGVAASEVFRKGITAFK